MSILLPGDDRPRGPFHKYPIYARSGWEIPQPDEYISEKSIEELRLKANTLMKQRREMILRSVSPHLYNCVGMIFASRRAVIEIDHIYQILREDGYREIRYNEILVGDVVLYKHNNEPTHVGVITQVNRIGDALNVRVLSKWGLLAEFEHFIENVPERYGQPTQYYTERQI